MNDIALSPVETASADEVRALQDRKLRRQMAYLKARSPFAAAKLAEAGAAFEDIRSVDDLAGLPFTTKQELRDSQRRHPPFGSHAAAIRERIVRVHASSGTTGVPSYIPVTAHDSALWREAIRRVFRCQGVRPDSTVAMGFSIGFFVGGIPLAQGIEDLGATFLPIGAGATDRLLDSIALMEADTLACTPSYALYLAEAARERGIDVAELPVTRLTVGAEPGGGIPAIRRQIEETWRATVTESVGNGDVVPVYAAESDVRDGCHFLTPDMVVMEIVDPDTGEVLPLEGDGVEGEMTFTHIDREAAPLLRFRSGDRVTVRTGRCDNGRTGPRIRVVGRTDDLLILRGVNVWPSAIQDVVAGFRPDTTGALRIVLPRPGPAADPPLHIRVEHGADARDLPALARALETALREKLIFTARVEPVPPGTLPRSTMKTRLVEVREAG
ncbi:MAG: hypothetical protein OYH76_11545 [Defluviicoccus sp.]|nr:hypothetical protein [Defluviicoccus sp.]MDE0276520.1 hypothetical protein [Defluviicoccus sp.]